ncbi:MAG: DUF3078 domain-containing protein [Cyanobacteria bacterium J06636_27]
MKKTILMLLAAFAVYFSSAQTKEELVAEMNSKKDSIAALQKKVNAIQAKIKAIPGWRLGAFGTVGGSISSFTNWYAQAIPNNTSGNIGFTFNTFANLRQDNYFWRNNASINLGWVRLDNRDIDTDSEDFEVTNDVFQLTSLFGWNLSKTIAVSALAEYRTTLVDNFNNPGYLDIGTGATWTPLADLVVVVHPLNYNFVFSDEGNIYESSLGAKIVADYTNRIGQVSFKTNFSSFVSYESDDLNNYTWTNGFSYTLWKSLGVGFDFALRSNKQEALDYSINTLGNTDETFETVDNELQSFWILGISYSF